MFEQMNKIGAEYGLYMLVIEVDALFFGDNDIHESQWLN